MNRGTTGAAKVDVEKFRLRRFVERLIDLGEVEIHDEPVPLTGLSPIIEATGKAVLFRKAGPERVEMVAKTAGNYRRLAAAFDTSEDKLHDELALLAPFTAVYSEPLVLWTEEGDLDTGALERGITRAKHLNAPRLKMSIGGWAKAPADAVAELKSVLADHPGIELLIENDQTETGGTLGALLAFFAAADAAGLPLGMTFDMGNWHFTGECPLRAAEALAPRRRETIWWASPNRFRERGR